MNKILIILSAFLAYGSVLFIVWLSTYIADRVVNKLQFSILSIIIVLIPSAFAALRATSVGTDVMVYAYPTYMSSLSYRNLIDFISSSQTEIGYTILVYLVSHVFGNFQILLFFTALLQIAPVYKCCTLLKKELGGITYPMIVYICIFYIAGFNVMRQSISCAWLLLAYVYTQKKQYIKAFSMMAIAFLFHSTSVIGVVFIVLSSVFDCIQDKRKKLFLCLMIFLSFVFVLRYWNTILHFLGNIGFLSYDKIIGYSNLMGGNVSGSSLYLIEKAQIIECMFRIAFLLLIILYQRRLDSKMFVTCIPSLCVGLMVYFYFFFAYHISYGYRVSMYAEYYLILLLPNISKNTISAPTYTETAQLKISFVTLISGVSVLLYWLVLYVILGSHGTYPFKLCV